MRGQFRKTIRARADPAETTLGRGAGVGVLGAGVLLPWVGVLGAVVKESAEGAARNGALSLTAGVIDKTVEEKLEYKALENEVGCGGNQGDVVFRTQAPGFALAESVWMARDGVFYGVICTVDGSKPDHLDLVPALGSSMHVDDVAIFPDAD